MKHISDIMILHIKMPFLCLGRAFLYAREGFLSNGEGKFSNMSNLSLNVKLGL